MYSFYYDNSEHTKSYDNQFEINNNLIKLINPRKSLSKHIIKFTDNDSSGYFGIIMNRVPVKKTRIFDLYKDVGKILDLSYLFGVSDLLFKTDNGVSYNSEDGLFFIQDNIMYITNAGYNIMHSDTFKTYCYLLTIDNQEYSLIINNKIGLSFNSQHLNPVNKLINIELDEDTLDFNFNEYSVLELFIFN